MCLVAEFMKHKKRCTLFNSIREHKFIKHKKMCISSIRDQNYPKVKLKVGSGSYSVYDKGGKKRRSCESSEFFVALDLRGTLRV